MMKPGIGTYTYPWAIGRKKAQTDKKATSLTLLNRAREVGIYSIQFADNLPLHMLSQPELEEILNYAEENRFQLEIGLCKLTETQISRYIPIANLASSPFIRVLIDGEDYEPSIDEIIQLINSRLLSLLKDNNIKLAIENHDRFTAEDLKKIVLDTDPDYIGICLDSANSFGIGEGLKHVVSTLAPYTFNLHLKDYIIERLPHKMGFKIEGSALGKGKLPAAWVLDEISKYDRCETATLEVWSSPLDNLEETLRREEKWAQESIQYVKEILNNDKEPTKTH